jgi:RHS repeat-associated protein
MAMKKRFYSVNGQMMGYESGGVKKDFLTDHLGSITAEIDQNQNRTFETRYSAYGRNNWSTGTGCGFGWVGSYGYRETGLFHMSHYVRARHYSYVTGNWSTVDAFWNLQSPYGYVMGRAVKRTDRTGCAPDDLIEKACGFKLCDKLNELQPKGDKFQALLNCMAGQGFNQPGDAERIRKGLEYIRSACPGGSSKTKPRFCLYGVSGGKLVSPGGSPVPDKCNIAAGCDPSIGFGGFAIGLVLPGITPPKGESCLVPNDCVKKNYGGRGGAPCDCVVVICADNLGRGADQFCKNGLIHELMHCAGFFGAPDHNANGNGGKRNDFVYNLGCCACKVLFGENDPACSGCGKRR